MHRHVLSYHALTCLHVQVLELLDYILNQKTSEKEYPNGTRDKGRGAVRLAWFLTHKKAQEARLTEAEVSLFLSSTLIKLRL